MLNSSMNVHYVYLILSGVSGLIKQQLMFKDKVALISDVQVALMRNDSLTDNSMIDSNQNMPF